MLADYLAEVEAGRPVDPEEWIAKHPAIAERLRTCLKGLHLVEEFAGSIGAGGDRKIAEPTDRRWVISASSARWVAAEWASSTKPSRRSLGRRVALKVLPFGAAIDPRRLARFRVESQAAALLHHPHIIPVYSVGSEGGVHYYAMQLIEGTTLAELIAELRRRRTATADPAAPASTPETFVDPCPRSRPIRRLLSRSRALGAQAALALEHAHENGVLHRDVKPSNLMVDGTGHLWVGGLRAGAVPDRLELDRLRRHPGHACGT